MAKEATKTKEDLEDNLFGGFKFLDKDVPKGTNKAENKGKEGEDKTAEEKKLEEARLKAEAQALKEAEEAANKKKGKTKDDEPEAEVETEEEPTTEEEEEDDENSGKESPLVVFARELNEKGIIEIEDPTKVESDEDLFKGIEDTIKKGIAERDSRLPEDAQKFLEFIENGGKPEDFHRLYYTSDSGSFEDFEASDDDDKKHIIRESLLVEGYTEEEADEEINDLVDLDKLDKKYNIHLKKLQKLEKENKKRLIEAQKEAAKKEEDRRRDEWANFKKGLFDKEEISGFKFNDKMKNDTWDYMTKIVDRKNGLTQYQIDSANNPDARYMFAYLLKNKWDVKALEKQVTTKAVSKLAKTLNNYTDSRQKIKQGTPTKEKDLEQNPFGGFKTIL